MRRIINTGLVLSAGIILAAGVIYGVPSADAAHLAQGAPAAETASEPQSRAEQVARAFVAGYPGRVERAEFRGGDWAVLLRGRWFHYSGGRMMPEELLYRAENYSPLFFFAEYPRDMPVWRPPTEEQLARFHAMGQVRATHNLPRAPYFFDALYEASCLETSRAQTVQVRFLGSNVLIHRAIERELALVEQAILAASSGDGEVRRWISEIGSMHGWNWRTIGGTLTRSFHAYGVAVDIIPRSNALAGREMFWAWAANRRADWWNIPMEGRYHPPAKVVQAFESYGFVWGGKWVFFDTMHFEFRPEVLILHGMSPTVLHP